MKLSELRDRIERTLQVQPRNADLEVVVVRRDPSMGAKASSKITNAGAGFDWDHGKFELFPEGGVYARNDEDEIKALRKQLDELAYANLGLRTQLRHFQNLVEKLEKASVPVSEGSAGEGSA